MSKRPEERLEALRRELWATLVPHPEDRRTHEQRVDDLQDALWSVAIAPPVQETAQLVARETSGHADCTTNNSITNSTITAAPCGADCGPWCAERCEACS